jgi:hypothetical protein
MSTDQFDLGSACFARNLCAPLPQARIRWASRLTGIGTIHRVLASSQFRAPEASGILAGALLTRIIVSRGLKSSSRNPGVNAMPMRSISELVTDLVAQLTTLVRKESELARVEMSENVAHAAVGLGLILAGAVLLIPGVVILLQAMVTALVESGIGGPWSALIVGGAALLIGLALTIIGRGRLKPDRFAPNQMMQQAQRDVSVTKDQARQTYEEQRAA